jgi:RNA recognition motif-containing protein
VGNLSFDVTREELMQAFGEAGRVVDAKVPTDRETGRPRGFAFVEFEDEETARRSIELMHGRDLKGRALRVNEAEDRPPRSSAGAGFSRGPGSGFSRGPGAGGFSRGPGAGSSRPSGLPRSFPPPEFPPPGERDEFGESRRRRFKQKPVRKSNPRRRRDQIADDDDY